MTGVDDDDEEGLSLNQFRELSLHSEFSSLGLGRSLLNK
jgi:hypothetical protein